MALPKRIVFFWAQGADQAPDLVQRCWQAWAEKNPNWSIEVADAETARKSFAAAGLRYCPQTIQGQADIFRVLDLMNNGGVYVDAATVPIQPLDDWLPPLVEQGFFAFHDPYRKRMVENWFLAAQPGNLVASAWAESILAYWDRPRVIQSRKRALDPGWKGAWSAWRDQRTKARATGAADAKRNRKSVIEPKTRVWSVAQDGGARRGLHPYFWPHYLFEHALNTKPSMREAWAKMPKVPSYQELMLRHWKHRYGEMNRDDIASLVHGAHMQKLALNKTPSSQQMADLFELAGLSDY